MRYLDPWDVLVVDRTWLPPATQVLLILHRRAGTKSWICGRNPGHLTSSAYSCAMEKLRDMALVESTKTWPRVYNLTDRGHEHARKIIHYLKCFAYERSL